MPKPGFKSTQGVESMNYLRWKLLPCPRMKTRKTNLSYRKVKNITFSWPELVDQESWSLKTLIFLPRIKCTGKNTLSCSDWFTQGKENKKGKLLKTFFILWICVRQANTILREWSRRKSALQIHFRSYVLCWVAQSWLTLCNLMDCSLSGSSVHGIL